MRVEGGVDSQTEHKKQKGPKPEDKMRVRDAWYPVRKENVIVLIFGESIATQDVEAARIRKVFLFPRLLMWRFFCQVTPLLLAVRRQYDVSGFP